MSLPLVAVAIDEREHTFRRSCKVNTVVLLPHLALRDCNNTNPQSLTQETERNDSSATQTNGQSYLQTPRDWGLMNR